MNRKCRPNWALCLWPGLARLWLHGDIPSLGLAIGFGLLLNLALSASFIWPQWVGQTWVLASWPALIVLWGASAWSSWRALPSLTAAGGIPADDSDGLFQQAQTEYLRGNWSRVESLLARRLRRYPRDVPARLLLATMYRRIGKSERASSQLEHLGRLDEGEPWRMEIQREFRAISETAGEVDPGGPSSEAASDDSAEARSQQAA